MKKILKIGAPWLFCILIFYYLFTKIPPNEVLSTLKFVNLPLFIFYSIIYFFIIHTLDCLTIKHFMSRFSTPISHKESWLVRGVSYLIMILNYHAAQGAFAIYFKKTHKAPISKSLGTLALISLLDMILVFTFAFIAFSKTEIVYNSFDFKSLFYIIAPITYGGFLLWILFWKNVDKPIIIKLRKFRFINWILKHDLFFIFREANLKDYIILFLFRFPIIIILIGAFNFALFTFHASVDWISLYVYNPIIMFVSTLPITPAGLGTGQLLIVEFFQNIVKSPIISHGDLTAKSILFASSLLWGLSNQFIKAIFSMICLSITSKNLFKDNHLQSSKQKFI